MRYLSINKDQLLQLLGEKLKPVPKALNKQTLGSVKPLGAEKYLAVWRSDRSPVGYVPDALIVDDAEIDSFFAFSTTYIGNIVPFSAYVRVFSLSIFKNLFKSDTIFDNYNKRSMAIGMTICETFSQIESGEQDELTQIPTAASFATLSYPLAQCLLAGYELDNFDLSLRRWIQTRRLLGAAERTKLSANSIVQVWLTAARAFEGGRKNKLKFSQNDKMNNIESYIDDIYNRKPSIFSLTNEIISIFPEIEEISLKMSGIKEERVRLLDGALNLLNSDKELSKIVKGFFAALLVGMVGNGSIKYLPLMSAITDEFEAAPIWYGIICGAYDPNGVRTIGGGLGRRIERDLVERSNILATPVHDVCWNEFVMLYSETRQDFPFRTSHVGQVLIELFPNVNAVFGRKRTDRRQSREVSKSIETKRIEEVARLIDQASFSLKEIMRDSQGDLFEVSKYERDSYRKKRS